MTAETDLLPLPEATMKSYQTDSTMRTMTLYSYSGSDMRDYARANLAELQREVEGLREYKRVSDECNESLRTFVKVEEARTAAAEARAERLAEALREIAHAEEGDSLIGQIARSALDQETTNV